MALKIFRECSDEALRELFDPAYKARLNCFLADALMTEAVAEAVRRGLASEEGALKEVVLDALSGPSRCRHGVSIAKNCQECDFFEDDEVDDIERPSVTSPENLEMIPVEYVPGVGLVRKG